MGQIHKEEANRSWKVHTYWHTWPTSMYLKAHGYWTCDYDIFTCDGRKGICFMWQKGHLNLIACCQKIQNIEEIERFYPKEVYIQTGKCKECMYIYTIVNQQ